MSPQLTVLSHLFPRDGVQLGRLVSNMAAPHDNYYPPTRVRYVKGDIYHITGNDLLDKRNKSNNSKLSAVIQSVLSAVLRREADIDTKIADTVCITYYLDNSEAKFNKLCQNDAAKKWFETTYRKRRMVYMVVGIQTITDASVWFQQNAESEVTACAEFNPAAVAGAPALAPSSKIKFMASRLTSRHVETGFVAENEQIYAILYRKVQLGLVEKHRDPSIETLGKSMLENGSRWEVMWKTMGAGQSQDPVVLEAVLGDETHVELRDGLESCEVEGETVVFVPLAELGETH